MTIIASRAAAEPYDGVIQGGGRFAFLHIFGMEKHMEVFECVWKHIKSIWKRMKAYEKRMKVYEKHMKA